MKTLKALLLTSVVVVSVTVEATAQQSADQVKARIDLVLGQVPSLLTSDPTGRSAQELVNRERLIIDTIQSYFMRYRERFMKARPLVKNAYDRMKRGSSFRANAN